jgi:hypothetical protein
MTSMIKQSILVGALCAPFGGDLANRDSCRRLPAGPADARVGHAHAYADRLPVQAWFVPLLTGLSAAWLAWDTFSKRGPTIIISFDSASGLTAGQSQLKYKNVVMGTVKSIDITPDLTSVLVTVETTHAAERLLKDTTVFWVVKPQLFAGSVSGLDTLLSGSYISLRPSADGAGKPQRHFVGQEDPPVCRPGRRERSSGWRPSDWARSASVRRSSSATSKSALCSAGISATLPTR